jgi:hypothetical protein
MLRAVRRALALGCVVATAVVVAAAAADGASTEKTYFRVAALAGFQYTLDYGSAQPSVYNGKYDKQIGWFMNAIAVYDGRSVSVPRGLMIVDGYVQVSDDRTQRASATTRRPVRCSVDDIYNTDRSLFSAGRISVSSAGLSIDPGPGIKRNVGCAATEALPNHGLPGGPELRVPAPARALFSGTKIFSIACKDSYSHPYKPAGVPNGHSFVGEVLFKVRFTPFPASKLTETKKWLRDRAGDSIPDFSTGKGFRDCS